MPHSSYLCNTYHILNTIHGLQNGIVHHNHIVMMIYYINNIFPRRTEGWLLSSTPFLARDLIVFNNKTHHFLKGFHDHALQIQVLHLDKTYHIPPIYGFSIAFYYFYFQGGGLDLNVAGCHGHPF